MNTQETSVTDGTEETEETTASETEETENSDIELLSLLDDSTTITDASQLPTGTGSYILGGDITAGGWSIPTHNDITLDLNGHNITFSGVIYIEFDASLTIIGSSDTSTFTLTSKDYVHSCIENVGGTITIEGNVKLVGTNAGYLISNTGGGATYIKDSVSLLSDGACINCLNGTVDINGGSIESKNNNGIFLEDLGIAIMTGGTLKAAKNGIYVGGEDCEIRIENGEINAGETGIIFSRFNDELNITNGTIKATKCGMSCGGYNIKINISGGEISSDGNGIELKGNNSVTIAGGTITGGNDDYAINLSAGTLQLNGNAIIKNRLNTKSIHLADGQKITIGGSLTPPADTNDKIRIDMQTPGVFTTGASAGTDPDIVDCFIAADPNYIVIANDDGELELAEPHYHEIDGKQVNFVKWEKTDSLPDKAGNYYLSENVTLSEAWNVPTGVTNICLNENSITTTGYVYHLIEIGADAKLNVFDEKANVGKIENSDSYGIVINSGELTVNGGNIIGDYAIGTEFGSTGGTVTINGGSIKGTYYAINSESEGASITINNGYFNNVCGSNTINNREGQIVINGGTIECPSDSSYAIQNHFSGCSIKITGGEITGGKVAAIDASNGTLEISGNANIETTESDSVGVYFMGSAFKLSSSPTISGAKASIKLGYGNKIDIDGTLTNTEPYVIDMATPGVFAAGAYAAQSKDKFTPSAKLASKGYEVIVTEGNELAIGIGYPHKVKPGETFETDNGTITNKDGTVEMEDKYGNKTTVTLPDASGSVEVDEDGNVTVPAGSKVQSGDIDVTLPDGGTVNKDGTITVPNGGTVQTGDTTVTLPNGGTVNKDGKVTADELKVGDVTVTGDGVTVEKDGTITVPNGGTVQTGDTTVTLPNGGTVNKDGNITVPEDGSVSVTQSDVTVEYAGNTKFTDGKNDHSGNDGVILLDIKNGDPKEITINGYEVKVVYDITLFYKDTTKTIKVQPNGKVKVTLDVPTDVDIEKAKVFHKEDDGSSTDMNASPAGNNKLSFEADHFSIYAIAVPSSTGGSGSGGSSSGGSSEDPSGAPSGGSYRPSYSVVTETSEKKETVLVKIENAITGKKTLVNADKVGNVVTVDLGSKCNGYYANIYNENGDLIAVGVIKDNKVSFNFIGSGDISLIVDEVSYAEDVSLGEGEFSSESEIVENSEVKTAVCVSTIFAAAIMTGIVLKKKKQ